MLTKFCNRRSLGLALLLAAHPLQACGPFFPNTVYNARETSLATLPEGTFSFEALQLLPQPSFRHTLDTSYNSGTAVQQGRLRAAEAAELTNEQVENVTALRTTTDAERETALAAALPAELALYTLGAKRYLEGNLDAAQQHWNALLELPASERRLRTTWAHYMLGKLHLARANRPGAEAAFSALRTAARAGFADSAGLAIAGLGDAARLHFYCNLPVIDANLCSTEALAAWGNDPNGLALAITGYAEQVAQGSNSGLASLTRVASTLTAQFDALSDAALEPGIVRSLLAMYAFTRSDFTYGRGTYASLLERLSSMDLSTMRNADRLATVAYREGEFELAEQLSEGLDTPRAHWVQAKLALRSNALESAAQHYALAAQQFPLTETWSTDPTVQSDPLRYFAQGYVDTQCRVQAESGVLSLARGEYVQALQQLFAAYPNYWQDTAYVAERVLTTDELAAFVDAAVPSAFSDYTRRPTYEERDLPEAQWSDYTTTSVQARGATALRTLLARRLVRDGRTEEALRYFDFPAVHAKATTYHEALQQAGSGSMLKRAEHLLAAAHSARFDGMEIMGYEGDPDYAEFQGMFDLNAPEVVYTNTESRMLPRLDILQTQDRWVSTDERQRMATHRADPMARYHYRYRAAALAEQAANLLPPRSQAFAVSLCEATRYLLNTDHARAEQFYRRYLREGPYVAWGRDFGKQCPAPRFDTLKQQQYQREAQRIEAVARTKLPQLALGLAYLAFALGTAWRYCGPTPSTKPR